MRKISLMLVMAMCSVLGNHGSACADGIVGAWLGIGVATVGGRFAHTLRFFPNGALHTEVMTSSAPMFPKGSGVTTCQGTYRFDGHVLQMYLSACAARFGPVQAVQLPPAPIHFNDPNTFIFGGITYRRR
jgi:hypothetical protein